MPFTGTVLDHLTKPRPDTRFCTGVLRQTYPVARPPVLPSMPAVTPAPAVMTNPASTPAAAAGNVAPATTPQGTSGAPGAAGVTSSGTAFPSATTAAASPATAAHPSTAAQDPEAATQQYEPAFATQRPSASPNAASRQADQQQGRVTPPGVKNEPGTTDAAKPEPATAHTALKQSEVEAGSQQQQTSDTPELHSAHQAVTTSSGDVAASNAPALVRQQQQQAQQQSQQQLHAATAVPVAAPAAGHGPLTSLPAGDPWNALHVAWDSDTPPAWPKLVCPWQVMALARSFLLFTQLTSSLIQDMLFRKECCVCTHSCCVAQVIHAELRHICTMEPHAFVHAFFAKHAFATCVLCIKGSFVHICVAVSSHERSVL